MKVARFFNILVVVAMLSAGIAYAPSAAAQAESPGAFVPGEVVVGFASGKGAPSFGIQAATLAESMNAQLVGQRGSMALLSFAEDADVEALASQIGAVKGVAYAEPNYVFSIPAPIAKTADIEPPTTITRHTKDGEEPLDVPVEVLKSLRTVRNGRVMATYPNDPQLWWNWGWWYVGADIVHPNTTASAGVCVLDTGVDYQHKDLGANIIKGYDFVNGDADPMDDHGHGTHVAGVISAIKNNSEGIAGVSSGKVVAVKVLNAQGWGTNFGVASGIYYCANRTDVKVLSLSLGGGYSLAVDNAVYYAVDIKGKLLVAAAGNSNSSTPSYPAGLSVYYPNKVLAVAALQEPYGCRAPYSNYGSWISVVAPGSDIYSTMPWDKPFYMGYYDGYNARYDYLSGTSMATPFVSAAAARRWGYKPAETNAQVGWAVKTSGWKIYADGSCWPASMAGIREVNVAALMDRGGMFGFVYNATTGLPLTGAKFEVSQYGSLKDTGLVSSIWSGYAEGINLPVGSGYTAKVNHTGTTAGSQPAFWHAGNRSIYGGYWNWIGRASVPNKSANFDVVAGWWDAGEDLDLDVWLPSHPNPYDPGQPAPFIVGPQGNAFGYLENDPTGTLMAFPFAIYNRDGGWFDWMPMESITISRRLAHTPLAANAALPYYAGYYYVGITDYGQGILSDVDPFVYVWKDGIIKWAAYNYGCGAQWWFPLRIWSGSSGSSPTYTWVDYCGGATPYAVVGGLREPSGTGVFMKFGK